MEAYIGNTTKKKKSSNEIKKIEKICEQKFCCFFLNLSSQDINLKNFCYCFSELYYYPLILLFLSVLQLLDPSHQMLMKFNQITEWKFMLLKASQQTLMMLIMLMDAVYIKIEN